MHKATRRILLSTLSLAIVLAALTNAGRLRSQEPELTRTGARRTLVVKAIEKTRGAVVNLHSERPGTNSPRPIQGMGSGIVIDSRGWIVTNHHVVDEVTNLTCRLADGASYKAEVMARDAALDLAIIKIDAKEPLPTMPLGTASDLMLGETVIAIGNAYGYEHTVSVGVVSALKRDVNLNPKMTYKGLIQTDAAINPGNSGGPLINVHGELIGVNVAVRDKAQNIGFAIPVEHMIGCVKELLHGRRSTYDGIVAADRLKDGPDGPVRSVEVESVDEQSPAGKAGLKAGDILLKLNDLPVVCSFDVERAMLERKSGDKVAVLLRRQGKEQRLQLVLADLKQDGNADAMIRSRLGLSLTAADSEKVKGANQFKGGLEVTDVVKDSIAARAGIRKGDVLVGLHSWETVTLDNVAFVLTHPELKTFSPLTFYIIRDGQVRKGQLQE